VTDRRRRPLLSLAALLTLTAGVPASAQLTEAGAPIRPPGWSMTPAIGVSQMWDDNPTLAGDGNVRTSDFVTAVRPAFSLGYRGRRTTLRSDYTGNFDFYRQQDELNTRDHRGVIDLTHQFTRRLQLFAQDHAMLAPTTGEALELGANVLRRQTTRMNAFRGGLEALFGPQTSLKTSYATQWIDFANDESTPLSNLLDGGYSHGGSAEFRHRLNQRIAVGADYDAQRAIVASGTETFDVQSALGVTDIALSPTVSASLSYGHAWLTAGRNGFRDSGPAFDVGLSWQGRRATGAVRYARSFLPSFGFGGTFQNEVLHASLRATLSRWVVWSGTVAVSDNDPLEAGDPTLRAVSAQTSLGWIVKRRLRLEVFANHVSQDSNVAGGHVLRTRAGVQATVSDTLRASR
jgi:uncharacterized protein (PEP-CTERM system associated)